MKYCEHEWKPAERVWCTARMALAGKIEGSTGERLRLRADDVVWRVADGELIVLDVRSSVYITVNRSARVLWDRLVDGATVDDLVEVLRDRYGIDEARAMADTRAFVDDLGSRGLLE